MEIVVKVEIVWLPTEAKFPIEDFQRLRDAHHNPANQRNYSHQDDRSDRNHHHDLQDHHARIVVMTSQNKAIWWHS